MACASSASPPGPRQYVGGGTGGNGHGHNASRDSPSHGHGPRSFLRTQLRPRVGPPARAPRRGDSEFESCPPRADSSPGAALTESDSDAEARHSYRYGCPCNGSSGRKPSRCRHGIAHSESAPATRICQAESPGPDSVASQRLGVGRGAGRPRRPGRRWPQPTAGKRRRGSSWRRNCHWQEWIDPISKSSYDYTRLFH